jgi:hypothetical protein
VVIIDTITEQTSSANYLGCNISEKMNEDMESNIVKYNKIDGIIKKHCKIMTEAVKIEVI